MEIINKSKNTVLANRAIIAQSLFSRVKGLLGRKDFKPGEALILKPCRSIHTFFMRFAIDVLFVGKDNRVIAALPSVKPFRLTPVYFYASFAIELPSRTIGSTFTSCQDTLLLKE